MTLAAISFVTTALCCLVAVSQFSLTPVISASYIDQERLHFLRQGLEITDWKGHMANCCEEIVDV